MSFVNHMKRRDFIAGQGAAAWPLAARAQQRAVSVIGFLGNGRGTALALLRQALSEQGYVEGRNVAIEARFADGRLDRLPQLATELTVGHVALIFANSAASALAAKAATATIPIVCNVAADPIELGLVARLNRPGGNITGVYSLRQATIAKRFQLLHEIVPTAGSVGLLVNQTDQAAEGEIREAGTAARSLGVQLAVLNVSTPDEIETVFVQIVAQRMGALLVSDESIGRFHAQIVALAARHSVPAMYAFRQAVEAGGLMSYGPDSAEILRVAAGYIGRILRGQNPADLPMQQATRIGAMLNLKTAKALGLTLPPSILILADAVIE